MPNPSSRSNLPVIKTAMVGVAMLIMSACASSPPADLPLQMERTKTTISQAEKAGALQGALPELQQAKDKFAGAEQSMSEKKYERANNLAKQAQADAEFALAKSQAAEAQRSAQEVKQSNDTLRQETERSLNQ